MKHYDPYENYKMVILTFFIKFGNCINLIIRNFPFSGCGKRKREEENS